MQDLGFIATSISLMVVAGSGAAVFLKVPKTKNYRAARVGNVTL
jgi:hypothetical protein